MSAANAVIGRANRLLAPRVTDRHDVPRRVRQRAGVSSEGDADRQSGPSAGGRRRGDALSGGKRSVPAPRLRRQPGCARDGRYRPPPGRDRPALSELRRRLAVSRAREEDVERVRSYTKAAVVTPRNRAVFRRSAVAASHLVITRGGIHRRRAFRHRPARSWRSCRTRSIRMSSPMPACSNAPAVGWCRMNSPRSGSPPNWKNSRHRHSGFREWRRRHGP